MKQIISWSFARRGMILVAIGILLLFQHARAGRVELTEVYSFDVPCVTAIYDYSISDIDYDGVPEILMRGNDSVWLYSPAADSVYFSTRCQSYPSQDILLADVNRDSVADVVIGYYNQGYDYTDSAAIIDVYDGAAGWACHRYYHPTPPYISYWGWDNEYYHYFAGPPFTSFCAYDLNNDGFNEFFFSYGYEVYEIHPGGLEYVRRIGGTAYLYYAYPDSLAWNSNVLVSNSTIRYFNDRSLMTATVKDTVEHTGNGPDYVISSTRVTLVTSAGFRYLRLLDPEPSPSAEKTLLDYKQVSGAFCQAYGQIEADNPDPDFLIFYYTDNYNYNTGEGSSTYENRLYRAIAPDSGQLIWKKTGTPLRNAVCLPQFAGSYFAALGSCFYRFSGDTREQVDSVGCAPSGNCRWDYPFEPYQPYLIVTSGGHVAIYTFTEVTDADDDTPLPLPKTLSLGKPYPNPFNAEQTIPVTVKTGSHLTVDVYDILGRKIERLFDGIADKSEFNLTWNAGAHASGVYFVKAASGDQTTVVRSILIK